MPKEKVRKVYPRARAERFKTNGGRGYTLIFADHTTFSKRLGEGDTTRAAWADAWKSLKNNPGPIKNVSP